MNDSFIPWWLALLLGMWAVALTLWVHPSVHREVRLWSGLLTLVYLALIFLALRVNPRQDLPSLTRSTLSRIADFSFAVCLAASLAASVYCLGPVSLKFRRLGYLIHTFANACLCVFLHQPEIALGLLIVVGVGARELVCDGSISGSTSVHEWLIAAIRFTSGPVSSAKWGEYWLVGGLVSILAFTLFGTISYALRTETSRVASSPRHTMLPTRDRLSEVLVNQSDPDRIASPLDLVVGRRSDLLVLMTVIIFLHLAMSMVHDTGASTSGARTAEITSRNGSGKTYEY